MNYKLLLLIVLCCPCWIAVSGQTSHYKPDVKTHSFQLATGIGGIFGRQHSGLLFNFEPRVNLHQFSDISSISIGSSIGIGPTGANDHRTKTDVDEVYGFVRTGYLFNIPVTFNYTYGNGATPRAFKKFGYSTGIGYAIHNATRKVDPGPGIDAAAVHAHGLICDAKFNFPIGNSSWSLHGSYLFNFSQHNADIRSLKSISLQYTIAYPVSNRETRRHYSHPPVYYKELRHRQKRREKKEENGN